MKFKVAGRYKYTYEIMDTATLTISEIVEADSKEEAIQIALERHEYEMEDGEIVDEDFSKLHIDQLPENWEEPEAVRLMRLGPQIAPDLFSLVPATQAQSAA